MTSLKDLLSASDSTEKDMASFITSTVDKQSGLSGMALKGALAAATKVDSDIVIKGSRRLLPELSDALDPLWQEYKGGTASSFGDFLSSDPDRTVAAIMDVADRNAENISVPGLGKVYNGVRSKAAKVLHSEVGAIGALIEKNAS